MLSIPATLKIYSKDLSEENAVMASIFVLAIPRIGESLHIAMDRDQNTRVYAVTAVTDVIHMPSTNLSKFPKVIIEVRILNEEGLTPHQ